MYIISITNTSRPQRGRTKHNQDSIHRCLVESSTPWSSLSVFNYMENIRLLWSRFVEVDCTVNYRTPLESKVIHKHPSPILHDPSGVEQSSANIRFTDALFHLKLPGGNYWYSITWKIFDSYGVALLWSFVL